MKTQKPESIHWIKGDSVCVVDGWCWAVTPLGRTVCIGREKDILEGNKEGRG